MPNLNPVLDPDSHPYLNPDLNSAVTLSLTLTPTQRRSLLPDGRHAVLWAHRRCMRRRPLREDPVAATSQTRHGPRSIGACRNRRRADRR